MLTYEHQLWETGLEHVAGLDEVGRGALAGPVVAAAVILPKNATIEGVRDSKTLTAPTRSRIFTAVYKTALAVGIGQASAREVDSINVLNASLCAMERAIANLSLPPDYLLIDGNQMLKQATCQQRAIIKGDRKSLTIAAASIVAKVIRDRIMHDLHNNHPAYGWNTNVGYPTRSHYEALRRVGPTSHHRRSFRLS